MKLNFPKEEEILEKIQNSTLLIGILKKGERGRATQRNQ